MLDAIASWPGAVWLQESATAYIFVNAAHIFGIGLLLGSIVPLDLRLLGLFRTFPLDVLRPFLARCAATGVTLAVATGAWLFTVKPAEYLENPAFRWKLVFLVAAIANVALQRGHSMPGEAEPRPVIRMSAVLSLCLWSSALVAGRWIGFL